MRKQERCYIPSAASVGSTYPSGKQFGSSWPQQELERAEVSASFPNQPLLSTCSARIHVPCPPSPSPQSCSCPPDFTQQTGAGLGLRAAKAAVMALHGGSLSLLLSALRGRSSLQGRSGGPAPREGAAGLWCCSSPRIFTWAGSRAPCSWEQLPATTQGLMN